MTISKTPSTHIRANELAAMKLERLAGASWSELEAKYGYHRTTIMRAVRNEIKPGAAAGVKKSIRFPADLAAAIDQHGGHAYVRDLVARDVAERARRG